MSTPSNATQISSRTPPFAHPRPQALVALQSLPARFAKATAPASVLAGLAALAWAGPSTLNFLGARAALSQPPPVARMLGAAQGMPSVRVANSNLTSADAQRLCALVRRHIGDVHLPPESGKKRAVLCVGRDASGWRVGSAVP